MHLKKLLIALTIGLSVACAGCALKSNTDTYNDTSEQSTAEATTSRETEQATEAETTSTEVTSEPTEETEPVSEKETTAETTEETEPSSEEQETETETASAVSDDGYFYYVDVGGMVHRTIINEEWPQTQYDKHAFSIVDKRASYSGEGYTYRLGIDVYEAYGEIDWEAVKNDGYDFAFVRIGYRGYITPSIVRDGNVFEYIAGAYEAGLDVGGYFFSQAITEEEAIEEAEYIIELFESNFIDKERLSMGIVYDPEDISDKAARTKDLTGEQITKNALAFCETLEEAGYKAMIYSNMVWEDKNFDLGELSDYDIWYADYEGLPQTPYAFSIWQYGHGESDGVKGAVDVDIEMIPIDQEEDN